MVTPLPSSFVREIAGGCPKEGVAFPDFFKMIGGSPPRMIENVSDFSLPRLLLECLE